MRRWLCARPADVIDIFVYVVVLNLAIEYVPSVISEGFTLSLLTAVLLMIALELVILLKNKVISALRSATTRAPRLPRRCPCGRSLPGAGSSYSSWSISSSATL